MLLLVIVGPCETKACTLTCFHNILCLLHARGVNWNFASRFPSPFSLCPVAIAATRAAIHQHVILWLSTCPTGDPMQPRVAGSSI